MLVFSLFGFPTKDSAEELKINPLELSVIDQITYFSNLYGGDPQVAVRVMECESGGKHSTVSDRGYSRGIFQFQKSTFERMAKAYGEVLDYNSQYDQVKLASWALAQPKYQNEWTTFVAIKSGGKYSFWSSLNQKHYIIYCSLV